MSKKRVFKSLDLVFEESLKDSFSDSSPLLGDKRKTKKLTPKISEPESLKSPKKVSKRQTKRKSFSSSLDILFSGSPAPIDSDTKKSTRKPRLSGIDLLIKSTIDPTKMRVEKVKPDKKRVTFVVNKSKLDKIKSIAKSDNAYIKDIFDKAITDYLQKKGLL